jgi:FO synthase
MEAPPSARESARALRRAQRGVSLDAREAEALLALRGDELAALAVVAARIRDAGLAEAGRPGVITYSPKVFIPLTRLCRDRCHYCTFAVGPADLRRLGQHEFLTPDEVLQIAGAGAAAGCAEALFTLGDAPESRWPQAARWLDEAGYDSTLSYLRASAIAVLEETGLLPHLNPGVMTWSDLRRLRPVAPSMGLMLETSSRRLFETPGEVHHGSPDKDPAVRLRVLQDAGRLNIPFTTGLLVGIGETGAEFIDSVLTLRQVAREFGHVQEVLVQNFRVKPDTAARNRRDLAADAYVAAVAVTRILMGPGARIQVPPNLSEPDTIVRLIDAGADDFGGISPVTPDHVNPERPWPQIQQLDALAGSRAFRLVPRLTVHPSYVRRPAAWIDPRLHAHVSALAGPDGLAAQPVRPRGRDWQEADPGYEEFAQRNGGGRTDLHVTIDLTGRDQDVRGDVGSVYGDWDEIARHARTTGASGSGPSSAGVPVDLRRALILAADDPAALARPANHDLALSLMTADGAALDELCRLADQVREATVGDPVTYVVNRNLNFTNVCYTGCRFCAFAQREQDADAFTLSLAQVGDRAAEAVAAGATEICMQGGIHPDLPGTAYFDLAREVKRRAPQVHLHAFSPMEIVNGATRAAMAIRDWLSAARDAGVDSIPGTAAEILDDDVRWVLTKGKLPTRQWIEVVTTAHELGIRSSATMMYGHVDRPEHWVAHLRTLRELQERTGGFTEFVPLPFVHQQSPIYLAGVARPGPTARDNRAVHAMGRLMLHGAIRNIQCSWVKLGPVGCGVMLQSGANDLGGTLMEETISRMAGSAHGSSMTADDLAGIAGLVGRPSAQRTTLYGTPAGV